MSVTVFGPRAIYLGCSAALLGEDERAMAWAEPHIVRNPALRYLVGRYVEADNPNENGHLFPLESLKSAQAHIAHSPLNMVHRPHHVVGHFMATEMLIPDATAAATGEHASVEALSAFYAYYFKEELVAVQSAHNTGQLFYSMECIPQEGITCPVEGCGQTAPYTGLQSPLYCEHMNAPGGAMRLNNPHFVGGALIVPPTKPGWKRADISSLSSLIETYDKEAEMAYAQVAEETPWLGPAEWEAIMVALLEGAAEEAEEATARNFTTEQRRKSAEKGHALPDESFPIENLGDLRNAIKLAGHAKDKAKAKAHILKRARELGASEEVLDRIRNMGD